MKKLVILAVVILSILFIYIGFKDKDIYYLSLGDDLSQGVTQYGNNDYGYSDFIKDYLNDKKVLEAYVTYGKSDLHTTDLIKDIKENIEISINGKKKHLQNALIKADIITLSIGNNDFLDNLNIDYEYSTTDLYNTFTESLKDIEELFALLRQYCKEKIILIGYYDYTKNDALNKFFSYVDIKMNDLTNIYNIQYVQISPGIINHLPEQSRYPNKEGYKLIADEIIKRLDFIK